MRPTTMTRAVSDPTTTSPPQLRRSKRNLASRKEESTSTVFDSPPPSTKKARRVKEPSKTKTKTKTAELRSPATLMSLNYDVQDKVLQYLDVDVSGFISSDSQA